jgi:hypothetical protein
MLASAIVANVPSVLLTVLLVAWIALALLAVLKLIRPASMPGVSWVGLLIGAVIVLVVWILLGGG